MFEAIFTTAELCAATSEEAWVQAMLRFEVELARAEADAGIVPVEAAKAIAAAASRLAVDADQLGAKARSAGNPVVPLVRALGDEAGPGAADFVHFGATSQDALDSAAMLVAAEAGRLVLAGLDRACAAAAELARNHGGALMAGRTLLQQALPITFARKAAGWLVGLVEAAERLAEVLERRLAVQLGGAAGTLAPLGERGPEVTAHLARRLGLAEPVLPWHTDRGRLAELAAALVSAAGSSAKVALDVALLAQSEVGEAAEGGDGQGHGGSSTLPHKQNPIGSVIALADARRAQGCASVLFASMLQEHERAAGAWHAEWQALSELLLSAGGAATKAAEVLEGLEVDPLQMAANLEATKGALFSERVVFDLAPELGRAAARSLVDRAARAALERRAPLAAVLAEDDQVQKLRSSDQLEALFDPAGYLGSSAEHVRRALAAHDAHRARRAKTTRRSKP